MSSTTTSHALTERIGVALVIMGAILLAIQLSPVFPAYVALTIGSTVLLGVAIGKRDSAQATLQFGFVVINSIGLLLALGAAHA